MRLAFDRMMNAITFAEAGEHETARSFLTNGPEATVPRTTEAGASGLVHTVRQYLKAITFAEEGEHTYARETLDEMFVPPCPATSKCILVMGNEDSFADYVIEYAIDMAGRFGYDIVALNALPLAKKSRILSGYANEIEEQFTRRSGEAGERFKARAEARGIGFRQEIMLMSEQKAMRRLHHECGNIEFVLTEPEHASPEEETVADGTVCVSSLVV